MFFKKCWSQLKGLGNLLSWYCHIQRGVWPIYIINSCLIYKPFITWVHLEGLCQEDIEWTIATACNAEQRKCNTCSKCSCFHNDMLRFTHVRWHTIKVQDTFLYPPHSPQPPNFLPELRNPIHLEASYTFLGKCFRRSEMILNTVLFNVSSNQIKLSNLLVVLIFLLADHV